MTNLDRLKNVFQDALDIAGTSDFNALEYGTSIGWDSVAQLALIVATEKTFGIMLSSDDVISIDSFGKAKEVLAKHGITFDT